MMSTLLTGHPASGAPDADDRPLVVGLGGTARRGSSSEICMRTALEAAEQAGARVELFTADDLDLPMYQPASSHRTERAVALVEAVRACDGLVRASPSYHGNVSGLVKNALDYLEDLRDDARPYLEGRAVGCVSCAAGWQGTVATLTSLRGIVHALRGWPTPLGVTVNSATPVVVDGAIEDAELRQRLRLLGEQVVGFARARRG
jgi:FMN reductase